MTKVQIAVSEDIPAAVLVEYTTVYIDPQSTHVIACDPTLGQRTECLRTGNEGTHSSLGRFQYGSSMMNDSDLHVMESHIVTILQNMYEEEHTRNNIQKRICKRLVISIFIVCAFFVGFYMIFHKEARSI